MSQTVPERTELAGPSPYGPTQNVAKMPEREQLVPVHADRIAKAIAVLFEDLDRLGSRVSPVLIYEDSPAGTMPGGVSTPTLQSEHASRLDGFANDLELLHRQFSDLTRRVDL